MPREITLLLVEDDDGDAKAVERAFRKARISNSMRRAVDGVEALAMLRGEDGHEPVQQPCTLLVDINMPRMNGLELLETLRADPALRRSVVFMLTTSKREEDRMAAYELNVAGYVLKETAGRDFLRLTELIDGYWRIVELP